MRSPAKALGFAAVLMLAASCSKHGDYLYYLNQKEPDNHLTVNVKEIHSASGNIDILWVIDNSSSMGPHQQNVIQNTGQFMHDFTQNHVSWKMGLISTDASQNPFIGFTTPFDWTDKTPEATFGAAVASLGLGGDTTEKTFDPILRALTNYPNFMRSDTPLAVLIVTDAPEQSTIDAPTFLKRFRALVGNSRPVFVYPVLGATDLAPPGGCPTQESPYAYVGSPYEAFTLNAKIGHAYSLCQPDFGATLGKIGNEIVQQIFHPEIRLSVRPKPLSIRVLYHGVPLRSGPRAAGGVWYYDSDSNAIVFYTLDFAVGDVQNVDVEFVTDDGLPETGTAPVPRGFKAGVASNFTDTWYDFNLTSESPHDYPNGGVKGVPIVIEGAKKLKVYFDRIDVENRADSVVVYDAKHNRVQELTGQHSDEWSTEIPGDRVFFEILADSSVTGYGYSVSKVSAVF